MARDACQAAVMKSRGRMVIVVAGGSNGHDTLDSVEILDPESDEGWKPGMGFNDCRTLFGRLKHFSQVFFPYLLFLVLFRIQAQNYPSD